MADSAGGGGGGSGLASAEEPIISKVMRHILQSMGAKKHEPRIIEQLIEFQHCELGHLVLPEPDACLCPCSIH